MRVTFTSQEAPIMPFRLLLLSDFGVGKTWLIGYIDKKLKELTGRGLLYQDFDIGHQTHKSAGFNLSTIVYFVEKNNQGRAYEEFDTDFHKYTTPFHIKRQFAGFAIDSLTTLQACAMDYVKTINKINRRLNMANENDYGVLVNVMTQLMPQILQVGRYAVFVMAAHTRERENKLTKEVEILPAISGRALPSQIGAWFNEVWYLKTEGWGNDVKVIAQTRSGNQVDCKSQTSGMPFELPATEAVDRIFESYGIKDLKVPEGPEADVEEASHQWE